MPYNYLVWTFTAQKGKEYVAKIGATKNTIQERMKAYKNGILITCCYVNKPFQIEKELKEKFKKKFIQRLDYGIEYFEGEFELMLSVFDNLVHEYKTVPKINIQDCKNVSIKEYKDEDVIIQYIKDTIDITNNNNDYVLSSDLYLLCDEYVNKNGKKCIKKLFNKHTGIKYQERNIGPKRQAGWIGVKIRTK